MVYKLFKETTDAHERLEQMVIILTIIVEETAALPAERYSSLFQRVLFVVAELLNATRKDGFRISDATYQRLDESLHGVLEETKVSIVENETRPTAEELRALESDFLDVSALVAEERRQTIAGVLEESDLLLSQAKESARRGNMTESRQTLQQVKAKVSGLESAIQASKIGAFNKATSICMGLLGLGMIPTLVQAAFSGALKEGPILTLLIAYIVAITMTTAHSWLWTKSETFKRRENDSGKFLTGSILLTVVAFLVSQAEYSPLPFGRSGLLYLSAGGFLGCIFVWGERRLIRFASKLKRHSFGLT